MTPKLWGRNILITNFTKSKRFFERKKITVSKREAVIFFAFQTYSAKGGKTMKSMAGDTCRLYQLKVGQTAIIKELWLEGETKWHLMEMGILVGTEVSMKKIAPLGEPKIISLRGYEMFLPKEILQHILVKVC